MSKVILSADSIKAGIAYVSADNKAQSNLLPRFVDLMWNDGVRTLTIRAKGEDGKACSENDALRGQIKEVVIIPAFPKNEQALLEKETKTLSEQDKFFKFKVQQKLGKYMSNFEKKIAEREHDEAVESGLIEPRAPKTENQKLQDQCDSLIRSYQKLEKPAFDVTECVKLLKQVKTITPAV
jgi:hypothetical protein